MKRFRIAILVLGTASLAVPAPPVHQPAAPPAAAKFLGLFDQLRAAEAHKGAQHVFFQFSDAEINDYMRYSLAATPRPGLKSITVKVFPHNYVSTFTVVDFDAVERWKPGTVPMLLKPVLNGQKSIWVDYRFQSDRSLISFSVEKAYYGSIRLPAFFVEKMIGIVAARQPEKYDTSKPLTIPFGLRHIWTNAHVMAGEN
jgi:hypothetical protein